MHDNATITLSAYFMGREREHADELSAALRHNAERLVARVNALLAQAGLRCRVNSGWRPRAINARIPNASPRSRHLSCEAVDLADPEGTLDSWCMQNLDALENLGLWLEHPSATPGWCHLQSVPPASGRRVFEP